MTIFLRWQLPTGDQSDQRTMIHCVTKKTSQRSEMLYNLIFPSHATGAQAPKEGEGGGISNASCDAKRVNDGTNVAGMPRHNEDARNMLMSLRNTLEHEHVYSGQVGRQISDSPDVEQMHRTISGSPRNACERAHVKDLGRQSVVNLH